MKYLISSVTIGACLLLSSAGDVFAQNPHPSGATGQLGTFGGMPGFASCGGTQTSPLGQVGNTTTKSPFPAGTANPPVVNPGSSAGTYAGAGPGNYGAGTTGMPNPHANSQYDNACLRQVP